MRVLYLVVNVDRNFEVFFNVVVARRPVLHFLLDELVQRTVAGRSAHRDASTKATPVNTMHTIRVCLRFSFAVSFTG